MLLFFSFYSIIGDWIILVTGYLYYNIDFVFKSSDLLENFPLIILGLLIVALILGVGNKPQEASPYGADMFGGMGAGGYDDYGGGLGGGMA